MLQHQHAIVVIVRVLMRLGCKMVNHLLKAQNRFEIDSSADIVLSRQKFEETYGYDILPF